MEINDDALASAREIARCFEEIRRHQRELSAHSEVAEMLGQSERASGGARWQTISWLAEKLSDEIHDVRCQLDALEGCVKRALSANYPAGGCAV